MTDYDELQFHVEKLLLLLKDRRPGLATWNEIVNERIRMILMEVEAIPLTSDAKATLDAVEEAMRLCDKCKPPPEAAGTCSIPLGSTSEEKGKWVVCPLAQIRRVWRGGK